MFHFQNVRLVALLIGRSTYRTPNSSEQSRVSMFLDFSKEIRHLCACHVFVA